jgi:prepilin-type N-terminal cleavage/methylation domain-containing protein
MVKEVTFHKQSGVTLVEMLVVIIIIAIVAALALMQRGSANAVFQRQNVATQLKNAFERARFDSVKRRVESGQEAYVTVSGTSYTLRTYNNDANGVSSPSDLVTTLPAGIVIGLYGGGTPSSQNVVFNKRGEATTSPAPQFYICNVSCSSPSNSNANLLIVTPTGTVNMLPGDATLPSFGIPTMTNVNTNTGISNTVVVP